MSLKILLFHPLAVYNFGAAIVVLTSPLVAETNVKVGFGMGESTIKKFFELADHPDPKECILLSTHEPCSMCLSSIAWSGFPQIYFLFGYEQTRNAFNIPYDIQILNEVFNCPKPSRKNKFFESFSLQEMVSQLSEPDLAKARLEKLQRIYNELSDVYQAREKKRS